MNDEEMRQKFSDMMLAKLYDIISPNINNDISHFFDGRLEEFFLFKGKHIPETVKYRLDNATKDGISITIKFFGQDKYCTQYKVNVSINLHGFSISIANRGINTGYEMYNEIYPYGQLA